jgi:hypothetical protein
MSDGAAKKRRPRLADERRPVDRRVSYVTKFTEFEIIA